MLSKLRGIRLRRRTTPRLTNGSTSRVERGSTTMAVLIQALTAMEKIAEIAPVPGLKGAVGLTLVILESVRVKTLPLSCHLPESF
jgi:hypothetical protein